MRIPVYTNKPSINSKETHDHKLYKVDTMLNFRYMYIVYGKSNTAIKDGTLYLYFSLQTLTLTRKWLSASGRITLILAF